MRRKPLSHLNLAFILQSFFKEWTRANRVTLGQEDEFQIQARGRPMKRHIHCPRCRIAWIDRERCSRCGYRVSRAEEKQERMGRLVRNGLIGLVSMLAVFWLVRLL